jgi:hypothetical protein
MLIFYTQVKNKTSLVPVVVIDAMSSDDRFSTTEIQKAVWSNAPDESSLKSLQVYSCEYSVQFEHIGIPIASALKSTFSATIKSPSADLILAFAPTFNNSASSISQMSDPNFKIPNVKTNITYSAMVVKGAGGNTISRKFIVYAAPLYPDPYGTLVTMFLQGAMIDDILIKSTVAVQIDKKTSFKSQMDKFLGKLKPPMTANYNYMPHPNDMPATEKIFPPMKLNNLLSELCLQNNLVYTIDYSKNVVNFYGAGQESAPEAIDYSIPEFSFQGSIGYMAWGLGVENYANIKFKSAIFDCKLFQKITIYNDIKSAFFGGLVKSPPSLSVNINNAYDAWVIRYVIKWGRNESICEVTASNNWIMSQFRVDGLMETAIYEGSGLL